MHPGLLISCNASVDANAPIQSITVSLNKPKGKVVLRFIYIRVKANMKASSLANYCIVPGCIYTKAMFEWLIKTGITRAVTYWNCAFSLRSSSVAANDWKTGVLTTASSDRLTVIWGGTTSGGLSLASVTLTVTVATSACVGSGSWTRTLNSIRRFPANRGFSKSIR